MNRAAPMALPAFFSRRFIHNNWVFATLPVGAGAAHGVAFDTSRKTLFCTCPFFPKPCWHAQALAVLLEREGAAAFEPAEALPEWVLQLHAGRSVRAPGPPAPDRAAGRRSERLERAGRGLQDLEAWLTDTLRRGIATAISEEPAFFDHIAGRMADASLRGLSRNFRLLGAYPAGAPDWTDRAMAVLADAALALEAFRRRDTLPESLLFDLEAFLGIPLKKETVLAQGERLGDTWAVTGAGEETVEESLRQRRTWLLGARSGRFALLLEYVHGELDFAPGFPPGALLEGELAFYPSAWPLRALVPGDLPVLSRPVEKLPGFDTAETMAQAYAAALGAQPWLSVFPAVLNAVLPFADHGRFGLADAEGKSLPLENGAAAGWPLVAAAGGQPLTVFGEWDGRAFRVLSAVTAGRVLAF